ncbi:MAG: glutamate-5-semialdehyde dehydrogenase [Clostridiales bacterium]|nr:glutamate-5-semialdehyde dehydrogenase [Clostridiales bacterium]
MTVREMGARAREAAVRLSQSADALRAQALGRMADALVESREALLRENRADLAAGKDAGLGEAMMDRLRLTPERISGMAKGLREIAALPDPLGITLWETRRPNGLSIRRVSVPLGVIAIIFEARPNVTADSSGLCVRSGNACILRGGKEAIRSNLHIARVLRGALKDSGLPEDAVQLVEDTTRQSAEELMRLTDAVDLLIPRGGKGLIDSVVENARVPVLKTGDGVCHIYVDKAAGPDMAARVVHNAKTSRPAVCNACECVLVHRDIAQKALPPIMEKLRDGGVVVHGDERARAIAPDCVPATEADWGREYLGLEMACKVVDSLDEALNHIRRYGTGHSEAIITSDSRAAERFLSEVDAAAVYHNASTRFTDGGEFGFGAEIGISTQKLHARGPAGLRELTGYKYVIVGEGQIR